jgi:hypothetical protein
VNYTARRQQPRGRNRGGLALMRDRHPSHGFRRASQIKCEAIAQPEERPRSMRKAIGSTPITLHQQHPLTGFGRDTRLRFEFRCYATQGTQVSGIWKPPGIRPQMQSSFTFIPPQSARSDLRSRRRFGSVQPMDHPGCLRFSRNAGRYISLTYCLSIRRVLNCETVVRIACFTMRIHFHGTPCTSRSKKVGTTDSSISR